MTPPAGYATLGGAPGRGGGLPLRIFPRDGQKLGRGPKADPAESPNADIVNAFLNVKDGQTFQTVPTEILSALHERLVVGS